MAWIFNEATPLYIQIKERLRADIVRGKYSSGVKLPSVRELAVSIAVNPNTVQRAFSELEAEGLIVTEGTTGRRVTTDESIISSANSSLAKNQIERFFGEMEKLGYTPDNVKKLISELYGEENDNG